MPDQCVTCGASVNMLNDGQCMACFWGHTPAQTDALRAQNEIARLKAEIARLACDGELRENAR